MMGLRVVVDTDHAGRGSLTGKVLQVTGLGVKLLARTVNNDLDLLKLIPFQPPSYYLDN